MKKVFLTVVVTILCSVMYTSCTPESLTNEDETEITVIDSENNESIDGEEQTGFSDPDEEPDPDDRG